VGETTVAADLHSNRAFFPVKTGCVHTLNLAPNAPCIMRPTFRIHPWAIRLLEPVVSKLDESEILPRTVSVLRQIPFFSGAGRCDLRGIQPVSWSEPRFSSAASCLAFRRKTRRKRSQNFCTTTMPTFSRLIGICGLLPRRREMGAGAVAGASGRAWHGI